MSDWIEFFGYCLNDMMSYVFGDINIFQIALTLTCIGVVVSSLYMRISLHFKNNDYVFGVFKKGDE